MNEEEYLPKTLPFGRLDTGIPISPRLSALLVGMGDGMKGWYDLIDQQFNPQRVATDNEIISRLLQNPQYGLNARAGQGLGLIADPGNLILSRLIGQKK